MGRKKIVKAFGRFVDETKARMGESLYPSEDHPLSASRMQKWVKNIAKTITMISTKEFGDDADWAEEENVEAFASHRALAMAIAFTKYANYVSVEEFRDAVKAVGEAVYDKCRTGQFDEVVLVLPDDSAKSGTWVTVLMWSYFSRWVTDVVDSSYDVKKYIMDEKDVVTGKRVLAVVCDDAMYSGLQMLEEIVEAFNIPVDKRPRRDDFTYMIAVPFVSPRAMDLIIELRFKRSGLVKQDALVRAKDFKMNENDNVVFALPDYHPKMRTLREHMEDAKDHSVPQLAEDTDTTFEATNAAATPLLNVDINITYFAHKLPDSISITNSIFAGAPFISLKKSHKAKEYRVTGFPLISGCDSDDFTTDVGDPYRPGTHIEQFARDGVCPITWYKEQITYMVDDEKVRSYENIVEAIESSVRRDSDDESDDDSDMGVRDRFRVGATITLDADAWWVDGGRIRSTKDNAFYCGHVDVPHRVLANWLTKRKPMRCTHLCPACAEEDDTWRLPQ